jgi:hypothetical protein
VISYEIAVEVNGAVTRMRTKNFHHFVAQIESGKSANAPLSFWLIFTSLSLNFH